MFFGHFFELMPEAFPFSVAWGISFGEKSQKAAFFRQKRLKNGLQATEKRKCFRHQFKKMPQKTQLTPKTIFMSIFIFCRTNVRDIYHFYVCLNCVEFNTFFTFTLIAATHLSNQDYNICFRRTIKACNICYSVNIAGSGSTGAQGSFGLRYGLWTYTDFAM